MAVDQVAVRLAVVGGTQFKNELNQAGVAGASAMTRIVAPSRAASAAIQNVGFQVQDFAVQVASGTSVARAFAQQLPQLASGFGPIGVAVGTLASVALPLLILAFSDTEEQASKVKEEIDKLYEATRNFQTTAQALRLGVDEVEVETVVALNKALKERAAIEAQIRAGNAANIAGGRLAGEGLEALTQEYSIVNETVRVLSAKVDGYRAARDEAAQLTAESERTKASTEQINSALAAAYGLYANLRGQASVLADETFRAARAASSLAYGNIMNTGDSGPDAARRSVQSLNGYDPRGTLASGAGGVKVVPRTVGGGGGVDPVAAEVKRLFDETRTAAEKYAIEQKKLDDLYASGAIKADVYARAQKQLKEKFQETGTFMASVGSAVKSSLGSLFDGIVEGGKSAGDVLEDLAKKLASLALQNSAFQLLAGLAPNIFGAGGSIPLIANAMGNAFLDGKVTAFASGGVVTRPTLFGMRGGAGLMGEAGPEGILPLTRVGGKLGVSAAGGRAPVVQIIDQRRGGGPAIEQRTETGPDGTSYIVAVVRDAKTRGEFDAADKARNGLMPIKVRR